MKVDMRNVQGLEDCWPWIGAKVKYNYGSLWDGSKVRSAHYLAYSLFRADNQPDMDLDHLCRNPNCVNPWHLEQVTHRENVLRGNAPHAINARKVTCIRGHALDTDNLYTNRNSRDCRTCAKYRASKRRQLLKTKQ